MKKKQMAVGFCLPGEEMQRIVIPETSYDKIIKKLTKEYGANVKFLYMTKLP